LYFESTDNPEDLESFKTVEKNAGRIEARICRKMNDASWLLPRHDWPGLKTAFCVERIVNERGKERQETSYYITSGDSSAKELLQIIWEHWKIESMHWLEAERGPGGRLVSVDGKTIRRSGNADHKAYHVVSAWVGEHGLTLGQLQVGEKTNEITEVPKLLDLLDIKGDIVTADSMSCQKDIAEKIKSKSADYILSLKGNQPTMEAEVKAYFDDLPQNSEEARKVSSWTSPVEKNHGRIEKRTVTVAPANWFEDKVL